jgi:hypothetical protein
VQAVSNVWFWLFCSDVFAAAKAGLLPITSVLDLAAHFSQEKEYCVISSLTTNLVTAAKVHSEQPYFPQLQVVLCSNLLLSLSLFCFVFALLLLLLI